MEVPVEHGLLLENLLDLAHAPFTHTSTFAKGWPIPDVVKFNAQKLLGGNWEPYPIDMAFEPPCMVLSTIGTLSALTPECMHCIIKQPSFSSVLSQPKTLCWRDGQWCYSGISSSSVSHLRRRSSSSDDGALQRATNHILHLARESIL